MDEITEVCNLERLNVRDLRVYLRDRGEKVSGTRPELVKRAKGVLKLGLKTKSVVDKEDASVASRRESEKFTTPLGETLPKPWTINGNWNSDIEKIPFMRAGDLYNYLVLNRNRTFDELSTNAKRQLKAKVFYDDKHVHNILYHDIETDCSHCYVKCNVIPSMPTANASKTPDYKVWVSLAKVSGNVHSAGCTCSAGEGESCNHVAALLYAIVDMSTKRKEGLHAAASTKCRWNQPRKRKLSPKKAQQLVFKKHKFDCENGSDERRRAMPKLGHLADASTNIVPLDTNTFREKLKLCAPHAAFLLSDSKYKIKEVEVPEEEVKCLHEITFLYHNKTDLKSEACVNYFESYFNELKNKYKEEECRIIEKNTRGQSKNNLWMKYRCGRLTSSNFGKICRMKSSTPVENTLKTVLNYNSNFKSKSTDWGENHENAARRVYCNNIQTEHQGLKTEQCGLIIDSKLPHLGSSPDALVHCSHCENEEGVLEIKCPYSWRFLSPIDASKDKSFFCDLVENSPKLKKHHPYYYQIQGQMAISHRKWCDFFVWTLKGFSIERIDFDPVFWSSVLKNINSFYISYILPELWSERVKRDLPLFQ